MGNGNPTGRDVAKSTIYSPEVMTSGVDGQALHDGGDTSPKDFCQVLRQYQFTAQGDRRPRVGEQIVLISGVQVFVQGMDDLRIGHLTGNAARAVQDCLGAGFDMAGTVMAFDPFTGTGTVGARGRKDV